MSEPERVNLGKGRPTPKRRDQQIRRGGPVPPPPTTRREASKRLRAKQAEARRSGKPQPTDPGARMLKRDQGPVRAMVRDVVDGRRSIAVLVIPVLLIYIIASLSGNNTFIRFVFPLYVGALVAIAFDLFSLSRSVKTRVRAEFPQDMERGHGRYAVLRAVSFRRMRAPAPRVSPGPLFRSRKGR